MLEIVFFASASSIIGLLVRAAMKKESARFCLYHSLIIGSLLGIYTYYQAPTLSILTTVQYIWIFIIFAIFGYVLSDVLESLTYIIKHPYNPLKMFAAVMKGFSKRRKRE